MHYSSELSTEIVTILYNNYFDLKYQICLRLPFLRSQKQSLKDIDIEFIRKNIYKYIRCLYERLYCEYVNLILNAKSKNIICTHN